MEFKYTINDDEQHIISTHKLDTKLPDNIQVYLDKVNINMVNNKFCELNITKLVITQSTIQSIENIKNIQSLKTLII